MLPHISIKAEEITQFFGLPITNSMLLSVIVFAFFIVLVTLYNIQARKKVKNKFFYFMNFILRAIYGLFESIFGAQTPRFFPIVGGFFFFILLQNWFGLLPGVGSLLVKLEVHGETELLPLLRSNTADLNTTLALAIIAMVLVQYFGIKETGLKYYLGKFFNFKNPINFFVGILELISEFSRVLSFAFRLFGNIFAGEVLLVIIAFLIPVLVSFPFLLLEVFVGIVQALVFSMLAAVLFKLAMTKEAH